MNYRKKVKLGELLVSKNVITTQQLEIALKEQKVRDLMLGETVVELGFASQSEINEALCERLGIDFVDMRTVEVAEDVLSLLDESFMRKNVLVPLGFEESDGSLKVAMADPTNIYAMDDVNIITGKQVVPYLADSSAIKAFLDRVLSSKEAQNIIDKYKKEQEVLINEEELDRERYRQADIESAPIVVLINNLIEAAVRNRASDIHIEPFKDTIRVRYRIDGELVTIAEIPKEKQAQLIGRLKAISNMHQEVQTDQDGRILMYPDYNIRVSSQRNVYGEKFVLRLLKKNSKVQQIFDLGFPRDQDLVNRSFNKKNSIVLVAAPTGEGKTTTLYSIIDFLNKPTINVTTIEDPVEIRMAGLNQIEIDGNRVTFSGALRTVLRQDPDIVLVGEIRDKETAEIALQAGQTGHYVLSTIHTIDSIEVITRLRKIGVSNYDIASTLATAVSQRLVRKVCKHCAVERDFTDEEKTILNGRNICEQYKPLVEKRIKQMGTYETALLRAGSTDSHRCIRHPGHQGKG